MRYLLDTSICVAALRKHPQVVQRLASVAPADCALSTISLYELFTGIEKCADPAAERKKVEAFQAPLTVLPFDMVAAQRAATARATLESQGRSIGPYDLLLAGQALASGLVLVTANVAEFNRIAGVVIENWQIP